MSIETMTVQAGETVNREKDIVASEQTVRLFNVSNNKKTGKNYKVDWTFDFSKCSPEEILDLAGRSAVIAFRKHFKDVDESSIQDFEKMTIDVKADVIAGERAKQSPTQKAKKLLASMTPEQRQAILDELGL